MHDPAKEATLKDEIEALEYNLTLHPPTQELVKMKMERIRADSKALGISILSNCPASRERDRAIETLEDACQLAISALARRS